MEKVTTKCLTKVPQRGERRGQRTERHVICKASDGSLIPHIFSIDRANKRI